MKIVKEPIHRYSLIRGILILFFLTISFFSATSHSLAFISFPNKIDTKQERMNIQLVLNAVMVPSPNLKVDGVLGKKSIQTIQAFQESRGLVPDGKVGAITRSALESAQTGVTTSTPNYTPAVTQTGCLSGALFNTLTGQPCASNNSSSISPGCSGNNKFNTITGAPCGNTTTTSSLPNGCTLTTKFNTITGKPCNISTGGGGSSGGGGGGGGGSSSSSTPATCSGADSHACNITNGTGSQTRTCNSGSWSSFGECIPTSCNTGYEISGNTCIASTCSGSATQACTITNGTGSQTRTCTLGEWSSFGTCTVSSCNNGYTMSNNTCVVVNEADTTPPTITSFSIPSTYSSLTVPISSFLATDNVGVTGYLLNESSTTPNPSSGSWTGTPSSVYTFISQGIKNLYAWAKDLAGNVSSSANDGVVVTTGESTCSGSAFRACSVLSGYGQQTCSNNVWSSCQIIICAPGFSLENNTCVSPEVSQSSSLLLAHNIASASDYTVVDSSTLPVGTVFESATCQGNSGLRSGGVGGTTDDPLYQSYCQIRNSGTFSYRVSPGTYKVRLYLMYPLNNQPLRVDFEGTTVFNIASPTLNQATILEHELEISDGELTVTLNGSNGYVFISALSIEGNGQLVSNEATCSDYIQNQDEEGIDCGGSCSACNLSCSAGEFGDTRSCLMPYGIGQQDCGEVNGGTYAWSRCYPISCASGLESNGLSCLSRGGWYSTLIDENCMGDTPRMMAFGIYDPYADRSLVNYFCGEGDSYLSYLDHSTSKIWSPPELVGDSSHQVDSHNYPQIVQTFDGNYHIFYGAHGDMVHHARTTNPRDLNSWISGPMLDFVYDAPIGLWQGIDEAINPSAWETQYGFRTSESKSFSYTKPVVARNGDLYLFYRNMYENGYVCGATRPHRRLAYTRSTDNGLTWEDPKEIIWRLNCTDDADNDGANDYVNEIYHSPVGIEPIREDVPERWHMVWVLAGGEAHDNEHRDLLHAYFEPATGTLFSQNGTPFGETITEDEMDPYSIVFYSNSTGYAAPISIDDQGQPVIAGSYYYAGSNPWAQYTPSALTETAFSYNFEDGCRYGYHSSGRIRSCDGGATWESYGLASLPDVTSSSGGSYSSAFTSPFHPSASIYSQFGGSFETVAGVERFGKAIAVVGHSSSLTAQELLVKPGAHIHAGATIPVYVYVTDEDGARVDDDGRQITLTVTGGSIVGSSTATTTNGMAQFSVTVGATQFLKLRASAVGLDSYLYQADI